MNSFHVLCATGLTCMFLVVPASGQTPGAAITVDAGAQIKAVNAGVFGANLEWFHDGNLIWNEATSSLRPAIVTATQSLGPSYLRFPGGTLADSYHWRDGIGPRQSRPVSPDSIDPGISNNNFGFHEFMAFCRATGAQPLVQANVINGTAAEASDWVRYTNAPIDAERALNGSAAPFGVQNWEIGNEQYLSPQIGMPGTLLKSTDYVSRLIAYSTAMKQVDPSINIGAVGGTNFGRYALLQDNNWNQTVLQQAGKYIDFLAVHNGYAPLFVDPNAQSFADVYGALLAFPTLVGNNLATLNQQIQQFAPADASRIKIAITEWGPLFSSAPSSPYVDHAKTLGSGVFTASMLRTFLLADRVNMANIFELTQPMFLGMVDPYGVVKPSFLAMKLFTRYFGTSIVQAAAAGPSYNSLAVGTVDAVENVPYIETIASMSADRHRLYVMVINKHQSASINAAIQIKNYAPATALQHVLTAPSVDANNGKDLPAVPGITWASQAAAPSHPMFNTGSAGTVAIRDSVFSFSHSNVQYNAPPMSVTVLEFHD